MPGEGTKVTGSVAEHHKLGTMTVGSIRSECPELPIGQPLLWADRLHLESFTAQGLNLFLQLIVLLL